jgi:hypothetical protein
MEAGAVVVAAVHGDVVGGYGEAHGREALDQASDSNLHLETSEMVAAAHVHAGAEAEMSRA